MGVHEKKDLYRYICLAYSKIEYAIKATSVSMFRIVDRSMLDAWAKPSISLKAVQRL